MSEFVYRDGELYHYGVIGMKWGVRRAKRHERLENKYRGKAQGTGSYVDGTYKPPKNTSDEAFTKNMTKADRHGRKGFNGINKEYRKASKKLDALAKKADKKLERAYNQRDRAYQKADSFFSTERGRRKALARANKAMRDATRSANHARRWVKSMEKTFADTHVSLTKEQIDLGRKYLDIMNRRTFG